MGEPIMLNLNQHVAPQELFNYGIQTEESDLRAHVSIVSNKVYVFPTKPAIELCKTGNYPSKLAWQPGVSYPTARGFVIPWNDIPFIVPVNAEIPILIQKFKEIDSTTVKGKKATNEVAWLLRRGWFPLMGAVPKEPTEMEAQVKGIDLIVSGIWKIQVKCDWKAGEGGSGNLYLQIAERNPKHMK